MSFLYCYKINNRGISLALKTPDTPIKKNEFIWTHYDVSQASNSNWLTRQEEVIGSNILNALLTNETRPRVLQTKEGILVILRGVNLNNNSDPEDMVSIRLWLEKNKIISVRRRKLTSIGDMVDLINKNEGPKDTGDFLCMLTEKIYEKLNPYIVELNKKIEDIEDEFIHDKNSAKLSDITDIHLKSSIFMRYLLPQKEVIEELIETDKLWISGEHRSRLAESLNHFLRMGEELMLITERASIIKEEMAFAQNNKLNKNLYFLSIITGIFLPLSFLTGLFGVNLAGIPGGDGGTAFWIFTGILFLILIIEIFLLRKIKWL